VSRDGIDDGTLALLVIPRLRNAMAVWTIEPWRSQLPPVCLTMTRRLEFVSCLLLTRDDNGASAPSVAPCSCNDGNGNSTWEGNVDGASTLLIPAHLRNNDGGSGGGSADNGAVASLVVPCSCGDDSGGGVREGSNDGASSSLVIPCSCNDDNGSGA
jgi:hypothetical protein